MNRQSLKILAQVVEVEENSQPISLSIHVGEHASIASTEILHANLQTLELTRVAVNGSANCKMVCPWDQKA